MKKIFPLLVIFLGVSHSFSQKVKFETLGNFKSIKPPLENTLQAFNSFYVEALVPDNEYELQSVVKAAVVDRFQGFQSANVREAGDFIIECNATSFEFGAEELITNTSTSKDGKKTTTYSYKCKYSGRVVLKVIGKDGTLYYDDNLGENYVIVGGSSSSPSGAKTELAKKKRSTKKEACKRLTEGLARNAADQYCYVKTPTEVYIFYVKEKKFKYTNLNKGVALFKKIIKSYNENMAATEESDTLSNELIEYWTADLKESNIEDKKARIDKHITGILHFNLGLAYFAVGDYDASKEHFITARDIDKSQCSSHKKWIALATDMVDRKHLIKEGGLSGLAK